MTSLQNIENLDALVGLEELWLGKNKITEIQVRNAQIHEVEVAKTPQEISHLKNLKILSIQSNRLTQISGLSDLPNLEELYISHNALNAISGLQNNTKLRVLDISNNQIVHLSNLGQLKGLEELWASSNMLQSFEEVERELVDKKELNTVYFEMNPLQLKNPALYRNKIKLAIPQIQQIDASTLSLIRFFELRADDCSICTSNMSIDQYEECTMINRPPSCFPNSQVHLPPPNLHDCSWSSPLPSPHC